MTSPRSHLTEPAFGGSRVPIPHRGIDSRPFATTGRARSAPLVAAAPPVQHDFATLAVGPDRAEPIQRLVVAGEDPESMLIKSSEKTARKQAGGPVERWSKAQLKDQTTIAIVAHGDVNSITLEGDDKDGEELAADLIKKNLEDKATLLLWACRAGMRKDETTSEKAPEKERTSLVETTAKKLEDEGKKGIKLQGYRGVHLFIGAGESSRMVDPKLTGGDPTKEESYLDDLSALNQHHVYLSDYFSKPYIKMYMSGEWKEVDRDLVSKVKRKIWTMDDDEFGEHADELTREEFRKREEKAHGLNKPNWVKDSTDFDNEKSRLWLKAGDELTKDPDFKAMTIAHSTATDKVMVRRAQTPT